jgi:hypothetical protein
VGLPAAAGAGDIGSWVHSTPAALRVTACMKKSSSACTQLVSS